MRSQALLLEPKIDPKWVPNRIFDAEALGKSLGSLLERSWSLLERSWTLLERSWSALEASWNDLSTILSTKTPPVKPDQVVGPESRVVST